MNNNFLNKKVEIIWKDSVLLNPNNWSIKSATEMKTVGILIDDIKDYYVLGEPDTIKIIDGTKHPEEKPKYYAIPKASVINFKTL